MAHTLSTFANGARPLQARACAVAAATLCMLALNPALAHDASDASIPATPGIQINAAAAVGYQHADQPVPAPRLTGVLGLGDTPTDQRGWALEHGTLGAGVRLTPLLGATVAIGKHGSERAHTEAAWVEARPSADSDFTLGAGRSRMPLGPVIGNAGHLDRFGQMPLIKRAAFNGDWIEDGVNLSWRPHLEGAFGWLQGIDAGLWRARRFPGSENAAWAPTVRARAAGAVWGNAGDWEADAFYSRLEPQGRGAYVQRSNSGHIHTAPQCSASLRDITCFDGTVDLLGASATWATPLPGVRLTAAGVLRNERGNLYSQNGDTRYKGRTSGGWLEALWQPTAQWDVAVRQEWLRGTHRLDGPGATLVATDANLLPYHPARRFTAMLGWRPRPSVLLALEAGRERIAGQGNNLVALRLVYTPGPLLERSW
ncbi:hypothetical protein [Acidovorax sp. HMWF029]|uniref:hypothetical protein n=1 Tax=Acidovorax sp. HMWF029 TaxID=2056863 RepID=UPI001E56E832|nr:hypothetical protein [Acidovorax sp. HMWF029]